MTSSRSSAARFSPERISVSAKTNGEWVRSSTAMYSPQGWAMPITRSRVGSAWRAASTVRTVSHNSSSSPRPRSEPAAQGRIEAGHALLPHLENLFDIEADQILGRFVGERQGLLGMFSCLGGRGLGDRPAERERGGAHLLEHCDRYLQPSSQPIG